jgi:LPXTG-site transpeptidase (sortase) family protein
MDFLYWKQQIETAKSNLKNYFKDAETCEKAYHNTDMNYNVFYSNVEILNANLCISNPKPDIQRRFLKRLEKDKLKSNTYAMVAKVLNGAVEFVSDVSDLDEQLSIAVKNSVINGRGILWLDYEPTIETNELGEEYVSDREIRIESLNPQEFLYSSAEKEKDIWWVARRHLLSREDIKRRFNYSPTEPELQFKQEDETQLKRGEVWEIWDKNSRKRAFILLSDVRQKFLEVTDDPYKLDGFFPCDTLEFVTNYTTPIPEYMIYRKQADLLEVVCKKAAQVEDEVKYVTLIGSQDKGIAQRITAAQNGDVLSIPTDNMVGAAESLIATTPVDKAILLLEHLQIEKEKLKQNIYDITGISDIMRGATDSQETATAQKIKGLFGSLRFQTRQKKVQNFRKNIYKLIAEIIAEHYDEQTLSEMTCTYLPTDEDKMNIVLAQKQGLASQDQLNELTEPTWGDVMYILRNDKLRSYTVDIETVATAFDDLEQQNAAIKDLTQLYLSMVQYSDSLSPATLKGFIPLIKMNLSSVKISSAVGNQLEEAIESAYKEAEEEAQVQQPNPDLMKIQSEIEYKQGELKIKEQEVAIKQQEADRKDAELEAQIYLKQQEISTGVDINANISGDVASIE